MTQAQLDRAVAATTGESIITVKNLGFSLMSPRRDTAEHDVQLALDCPFCDRPVPYPGRTRDGALPMAECARCDVYFDFQPDEVYASASAMSATSP
jgi:hypothetical protein